MHKTRKFFESLLLMVSAVILFSVGSASAVEKTGPGEDILLDTYHRIEAKIGKNSFDFPLFLESFEKDNNKHVDVYGIFDYPFGSIVNVLKVPANWCDIVFLHLNTKACTYRELQGDWQLTFYLGRKFYQPPEDTRQIIYHFRNVVQHKGYLDILLNSDKGPLGTKDHKIRFEALPLDEKRTFIHFSYEYSDSTSLRFAEMIYFATLGRGKVGFTVTDTDKNGQPVYISGPRGAIERNAVRYYFAIQSFMNTLHYPKESRFSKRINEWYDLTNIHKKQLYELEKKDYLTFKEKEHLNQVELQKKTVTRQQ